MDINQLVSFVDYQLGQKQGWDALSEVLHKLKDADDQVAQAKSIVDKYAQEVEDMKGTLVQMDETAKVKKVELQEQLDAVKEAHETALSISTDQLKQQVASLEKAQGDLTLKASILEADIALLEGQKQSLERQTAEALDKFQEIQSKLAAVKASI